MISIGKYSSPLGEMTMFGSEDGLKGLWFDGQKYFGSGLPEKYETKEIPVFRDTKRWLDLYFQGANPGFTPELSINTTPFRRMVWEILLKIPYGETMTYGQIAGLIVVQTGRKRMSAQAVGGAVGHNPISLIIPCHRVVGSDGNLTGYAGGIRRKEALLQLEHSVIDRLYV